MNIHTPRKRISVLKYGISAFAVATTLAFGIQASYAADEAEAEDEDIILEEVIVTGSRIKRADFDTVSPTVVVNAEFIDNRGFTNVADALNEIPAFGIPGNSPTGGQGAADVGQNFVSFFGLGSQRTLTLVNGRRFVAANSPTNFNGAAPGLQVDLNVIPTGLVERIETIATTGAPIYGSDAIAGTVNIILKKDFSGVELDGSYGISDRGDGEEKRVRALIGGNFGDDRGNAVISFEYNKKDGLTGIDREITNESLSFQSNPDNTGSEDGIPDRVLIKNARVLFATFGGQPSLFFGNVLFGQPITGGVEGQILHFAPSGDLVPFDRGQQFGNIFASGGDGVHLAQLANLTTPSERFLINGMGHYKVTDYMEAYMETFFANSKANDQISQAVWQTDFFGGSSGAVQQNTNNPLLSSQAAGLIRDECDAAGVLEEGNCDFLIARSSRDLALGNNSSELNMFRIVGGLRGDFNVGDRSFNWDVSYNFGRSKSNSNQDGVDDRRMSFALDPIAFTQANIDNDLDSGAGYNIVRNGSVLMNVLGGDVQVGDIGCAVVLETRTPAGTNISLEEGSEQLDIDTCVPMSIFGEGAVSDQARAYVNTPFGSTTEIQQQIIQATIGGDLFDLPAGSFSAAFGFEHRRELADFQPDFNLQRGGGRSAPFNPVTGGYNTTEFYGEFYAPVLNSEIVDFVSDLTLEGAVRHVDNTRSGGAWTWTAGASITPNILKDAFTFRGNFTRSIRSPAVTELFLPTSNIFTRANDPCDESNIGSPEHPTREANCKAHATALGLDPSIVDGFQSNVVNGTVEGTQVGNPNLENEVADSFTVGMVFQPSFASGLSLSIDYVDISISNAISDLGGTQVTEACYDAASFGEPVCDQITRGSDFQVTFLQTGFTNAGSREFKAITANLDYSFDVNEAFGDSEGDWGQIALQGTFFHLIKDELSITGSDRDDQKGEIGRSVDRGQLNILYEYQEFGFLWQTRYIGPAVFNNNDTDESRDVLGVGSYWNFNAALSYQVTEFLEARVNIDNVFDTREPFAAGASGNGIVTYDFMGRYYRFGLKAKF